MERESVKTFSFHFTKICSEDRMGCSRAHFAARRVYFMLKNKKCQALLIAASAFIGINGNVYGSNGYGFSGNGLENLKEKFRKDHQEALNYRPERKLTSTSRLPVPLVSGPDFERIERNVQSRKTSSSVFEDQEPSFFCKMQAYGIEFLEKYLMYVENEDLKTALESFAKIAPEYVRVNGLPAPEYSCNQPTCIMFDQLINLLIDIRDHKKIWSQDIHNFARNTLIPYFRTNKWRNRERGNYDFVMEWLDSF